MTENNTELTKEEYQKVDNYLKSYRFCQRLIMLGNYEKKYFETLEWESETPAEFSVARAKMFEVRYFILELPNCYEKELLYFHYVHGDTVEKCAELLGVSRASAFRLKKKALALAYRHSIAEKKPLNAF